MEEHRGRWTCVITLKGELHWPTTSDMPSCCCPSTSLVTVQCTSCHSSRPWWWFKNEEGDWDDWGLSAVQRCLPELWRICLPLIWYTFNYQLYNSSGSTWVKFQQQVKKKKEKNFVKWWEPHMLKSQLSSIEWSSWAYRYIFRHYSMSFAVPSTVGSWKIDKRWLRP